MKLIWIGPERKEYSFFRQYAEGFGIVLTSQAELLAATDDAGTVMGYLATMGLNTTQELLFFTVFEAYRGKGVSHFLLEQYLRLASHAKMKLCRSVLPKHEPMHRLFVSEGFDLFPGETEFAISFKNLTTSSKYKDFFLGNAPMNVKMFSRLSSREHEDLMDFMTETGATRAPAFDPTLSSVRFMGGRVFSLMLCDKIQRGIALTYLFTRQGQPMLLLEHFRALFKIIQSFGESAGEPLLLFDINEEKNRKLASTLAGDMVPVEEKNAEVIAVKNLIPS